MPGGIPIAIVSKDFSIHYEGSDMTMSHLDVDQILTYF